jgi:hypothetical protein
LSFSRFCALGLVELLLRELRDAEREPVVAGAALGDDLREDLLGALQAVVLEELLRVDARAVQVIGLLLPVLVEAGEQVLQADRDRPALIVLHLHRGAVEAEQLPHLIGRHHGRALVEERLELVVDLRERNHDQGVARDAARKSAHRRDDRCAARDLKPCCQTLLLSAVGRH